MQSIESLISTLSGWVWGPPMLILLVGTGLYLTFCCAACNSVPWDMPFG